jgi:hypothetical protein
MTILCCVLIDTLAIWSTNSWRDIKRLATPHRRNILAGMVCRSLRESAIRPPQLAKRCGQAAKSGLTIIQRSLGKAKFVEHRLNLNFSSLVGTIDG